MERRQTIEIDGLIYDVAVHGEIPLNRRDRVSMKRSVWCIDERGDVFCSCTNRRCRAILKVTRRINYDVGMNFSNGVSCVVCDACGDHIWYKLDGWKKFWDPKE